MNCTVLYSTLEHYDESRQCLCGCCPVTYSCSLLLKKKPRTRARAFPRLDGRARELRPVRQRRTHKHYRNVTIIEVTIITLKLLELQLEERRTTTVSSKFVQSL